MITKKRTYVRSRYQFKNGPMVSTMEMVCTPCASLIPDTSLITLTVATNVDEYLYEGIAIQEICSVCGLPIEDDEEE